jgi:hypothetical protein
MSKRLQVVVHDAEFERYARSARARGLSISEWVRQVLGRAERDISDGDLDAKLAAVRTAVQHSFPTADIDTMLAEIEQGYGASLSQ